MTWLLREMSLPHLARHRARTALTVVGIALGIGALVASQGVTGAVIESFRRMVEATAGRADLEIGNGGVGVPEALGEEVRALPGVAAVSPLVQGFVPVRDGGATLAVFGVDILADEEHEAQLPRSAVELPDQLLFVSRPDSIALARAFAASHGLDLDATVDVVTPAGPRRLVVRGLVDAVGPAALFGGAVGLMDLPGAQRLLGKEGKFDRIDVRLTPGAALAEVSGAVAALARGRGRVEEAARHGARGGDLLFAPRVLFTITGYLVALVGFFIIYHTVAVSVVQRRREIALLGALGITRRTVLGWLTAETAVLGVVAAAFGLPAGVAIARLAVATFEGVASVFVRVPAAAVSPSLSLLVVAAGAGLVVTIVATLLASWPVVSRPAARVLHQAAGGRSPVQTARWAVVGACAGLAGAAGLVAMAPHGLAYAPLVALLTTVNCLALLGVALLAPALALCVGWLGTAIAGRRRGLGLLLASGTVVHSPAGPLAAVAAIVVGIGVTSNNAAVVSSLKSTWLRWLDAHYQADLQLSAGGMLVSLLTHPPIAGSVVPEVRAMPGVRDVQAIRFVEVEYDGRPIVLEAMDPSSRGLPVRAGTWDAIAPAFWAGEGVVVNDNLAFRSGLGRGDAIVLATPAGERRFPVLGVFSDFQIGVLGGVALSRRLFEDTWQDTQVSRILVWTHPDADVGTVQAEVERRYGRTHDLHAITARQLRGTIAGILDDAFSGAQALALVSLLIAAVGVTNFLLARVLDRRGELATLTALGVPARQIGRSVIAEGLVVGSVGAGVGLVAAIVVSRLVVLRCSALITGWRLTYELPVGTVLALCAATVVLAGSAGVLPARAALRRASLAMEDSR